MRNRFVVVGVCCAVVVVLSNVARLRAQPLADRVPEDAIVYFGWCGASGLPSGYQQSHLKALLDESNLPELFSQFMPALVQKIAREEPEAGEGLNAFMTISRSMWQHPTAFYFGGVD